MKLENTQVAPEVAPEVAIAVAAAVAEGVGAGTDAALVAAYGDASEDAALAAVRRVAALRPTNPVRAHRLWVAAMGGASDKDLRWAAEARKSGVAHVEVETRYGGLSRGKCWARRAGRGDAEWADKRGGTVLLTEGEWVVGSDDGFRRKDKTTEWEVRRIGLYLFAA